MSGGYFDRGTYAMREIANTIERDIARHLNLNLKNSRGLLDYLRERLLWLIP